MNTLRVLQEISADSAARALSNCPTFDMGDELPRPVELASTTRRFFKSVVNSPDGEFSSWMPGLPLPALLASKRRVTVDIAPHFLRNARRFYGVSAKTMLALGKRKMLFFNIRDFDPTASEERMASQAASYDPYADFIAELIDVAPDSIYFLPSIRHALFDAIPKQRGKENTLLDYYEESESLLPIGNEAAKLDDTDPAVLSLLFRGERTHVEATRWHWAYVNAMGLFVPPDVMASIQDRFAHLSSAPPSWVTATEFIQFQNRMRYLHLMYSAPLSASFGGPYGMSLRDDYTFLQAVRHSEKDVFDYDYMPDRLLDLIYDLQMGRIRPEFRQHLADRHWQLLRQFASETVQRTETTTYFDHFDDETNISELIAYFEAGRETLVTYQGLEDEMHRLLDNEGDIAPDTLLDIASSTIEARYLRNGELMKATEGFLTVRSPESDGEVPGASPVRVTNLRAVNLVWHLLSKIAGWSTNLMPAVAGAGDTGKVGYDSPTGFRSSPN